MTFSLWIFSAGINRVVKLNIDPKNEKRGKTWRTKFSLLWSVRSTLDKNREQTDHQGINIASVNWKQTFI